MRLLLVVKLFGNLKNVISDLISNVVLNIFRFFFDYNDYSEKENNFDIVELLL